MNAVTKTVIVGREAGARLERARLHLVALLESVQTTEARAAGFAPARDVVDSVTFILHLSALLCGPIGSLTIVEGTDEAVAGDGQAWPGWVRYSLPRDVVSCERCGDVLEHVSKQEVVEHRVRPLTGIAAFVAKHARCAS
jgi:hypothetical protein